MSDAVEGGAVLAWRLLATLEGGSLLLAASALLAYTARARITKRSRDRRVIRTVFVTNTSNLLGRELKNQLESRGCVVTSVTGGAASGAGSGAESGQARVDALVVIGAEAKAGDLDGMARLISEDVHSNLKVLECLSPLVRRGGCIAWACAGAEAARGAFQGAGTAFDTVIQASLQHVAKITNCDPVWVGRGDGVERTAERVVAALLDCNSTQYAFRFSIRNAAHKVGEYVCRCLKIVT